jgi:hypothetical protein
MNEGVILWGDRIFGTAHLFLGNGDERPVAEAMLDGRPGWQFFNSDVARQAQNARNRLLKQPRNASEEKILERQIASTLLDHGFKCRWQVCCAQGVVDIVIDDPLCLIEVKAYSDMQSVASAAGQLWRYRECFPGAKLFFAAPTPADYAARNFLKKLGIAIWN